MAAGWPQSLIPQAEAVAWCESRDRPSSDNGRDLGLFQLDPIWFGYAGIPLNEWADPVQNARVALAVYDYSSGWGQWQCQP